MKPVVSMIGLRYGFGELFDSSQASQIRFGIIAMSNGARKVLLLARIAFPDAAGLFHFGFAFHFASPISFAFVGATGHSNLL